MGERRKYEGPVCVESDSAEPNAADQLPEQFVSVSFGKLSDDMRGILGVSENPEAYMHLELLFRQNFWKERHDILEKVVQDLVRFVCASKMEVSSLLKELGRSHDDGSARQAIVERLNDVPGCFTQIPEWMKL